MNTKKLDELATRVRGISPRGRRTLIAIAGPPASGKSRLAAALVERLNRQADSTVLVPMDGFHLDNGLLEPRGLLSRKGAPETFDGAGFVHAVSRLAEEDDVILPTFDRSRDISVAGAISVGATHRIAVVEGNYLCFDEAPWAALANLWDLSVYMEFDEAVLLDRLTRRWIKHGLDAEAARERATRNDLANARQIGSMSAGYDVKISEELT